MWDKMVRSSLQPKQWDLIDPDHPEKHVMLAIRQPPNIEDYASKYIAAVSEYKLKKAVYNMVTNPNNTQASSATAGRTRSQDPPERPVTPDPLDPTLSISVDEIPIWRVHTEQWKTKNQIATTQENDVSRCKAVVTTRLGVLAMPNFQPWMTPAEIYLALSTRFTPENNTQLLRAERQYQAAIKPPTHTGKTDLRNWLTTWQTAVANGLEYKAPCVMNPDTLCRELVAAIGATLMYAQYHMGFNSDAVPRVNRSIPPTYIEMAKAVEDDWLKKDRHDVNVHQSRRGAFFSGQYEASQDSVESSVDNSTNELVSRDAYMRGGGRGTGRGGSTSNNTRGRGRSRGGAQQYDSSHGERSLSHRRDRCPACEGTHYIDRCWWLDTEVREAKGFTLDKSLAGYVKVVKNKDNDEVRKWVRMRKAGHDTPYSRAYWAELFPSK